MPFLMQDLFQDLDVTLAGYDEILNCSIQSCLQQFFEKKMNHLNMFILDIEIF